jgi:hypothetical protein
LERLKGFAYIIFILSLIPGDTFYGDLGIAQSYFLIPVVLLYFIKPGKRFKKGSIYPILFIIGVATFYLFMDLRGSYIEWYRILGNIFVLLILPDMYQDRSKGFIIIPMILIGAIPALAFYFGLWDFRYEFQLRMSFLRHDPNILSHNLLYSYIFTLYYFRFLNYRWLAKYVFIFAISAFYLVPIIATISRTAMFAFLMIFSLYILYAERKKYFRLLTLGLSFIVITVVTIKVANNQMIGALVERLDETDNARIGFMESTFNVVKNNFFTGVGLSNFGNEEWRIKSGFYMYSDGVVVRTSSHNGIMDIMMIGGIFFVISFLYILFYPWYKIQRCKKLYASSASEFHFDRFLAMTVCLTFILINLTYSSYMSKTAWTSVTILYFILHWVKPNELKSNKENLILKH